MVEAIQSVILLAVLGLLAWHLKLHETVVAPQTKDKKIILDTCALIDGRIVELSNSGFVSSTLVVPEFILHELQMLADGSDAHKRERARYGLDVVKQLQSIECCTVSIDTTDLGRQPTDDKLVELAIKLKAALYTTDFNLNKLAEIKGVRVLNINQLAQNLRPTALPGERKTVKIIQKGSNPKQGVGYLEDGTMLVVDNAAKYIGRTVDAEVTRTHQTVAGKMLFGELINPHPEPAARATRSVPTKPNPAASLTSRLRRLK